jgi:hypothetical protein
MEEFWASFITGFCKVEFLCYNAEPNWLGWVAIVWGGLMAVALLLAAIGAMFTA